MNTYSVTLSAWFSHLRDIHKRVEASSMDEAVQKVFDGIKPEDRYLWREKCVSRLRLGAGADM